MHKTLERVRAYSAGQGGPKSVTGRIKRWVRTFGVKSTMSSRRTCARYGLYLFYVVQAQTIVCGAFKITPSRIYDSLVKL